MFLIQCLWLCQHYFFLSVLFRQDSGNVIQKINDSVYHALGPISALASLVSSSPPHVTMSFSLVVCHLPSFLRVLPTVVCSSPVSRSSSSAFLSALVTLAIFRTRLFRTCVAFVVVVRSLPRFPFRIAMPMSNHTSARDLALQSFWDPPVRHHPLNCSPRIRSGLCSPTQA